MVIVTPKQSLGARHTNHPILVGGGTGEGSGHGTDSKFVRLILPPGQCVGDKYPLYDECGNKLTDVDVIDFNGDGKIDEPQSIKDHWPFGEKFVGDDKGITTKDNSTGIILRPVPFTNLVFPDPGIKTGW